MGKTILLLALYCLIMVFGEHAVAGDALLSDSCDNMFPGDANNSGSVNVGDAAHLIEFFCRDGPAPDPIANGDYNGDCLIDSIDVYASFMYAFKCKDNDKCGYPPPVECTCIEPDIGDFYADPCFKAVAGDANGDQLLNLADGVYLINYIFKSGSRPQPYGYHYSGDANCDCITDVGDIVYLVNFVFRKGPPPCDCAGWIQSCGNCTYLIIDWILRN